MSTLTAAKDEEVKLQFAVFDIDGLTPLTGLLDGDFTKLVLQDDTDVTGSVAVTVAEVGATARYVATFTPNADGRWYVDILVNDTDELFHEHIEVGIGAMLKICEIHKILGLDPDCPLCVSKTQQRACDIILNQTEVGVTLVIQRES